MEPGTDLDTVPVEAAVPEAGYKDQPGSHILEPAGPDSLDQRHWQGMEKAAAAVAAAAVVGVVEDSSSGNPGQPGPRHKS